MLLKNLTQNTEKQWYKKTKYDIGENWVKKCDSTVDSNIECWVLHTISINIKTIIVLLEIFISL